jgi:hypothetical protein
MTDTEQLILEEVRGLRRDVRTLAGTITGKHGIARRTDRLQWQMKLAVGILGILFTAVAYAQAERWLGPKQPSGADATVVRNR